jgi:hypothetical protein
MMPILFLWADHLRADRDSRSAALIDPESDWRGDYGMIVIEAGSGAREEAAR